MKQLRYLLIALCITALLSISAFAGDCHDLSEEWFGSDGSDSSVLELETVTVTNSSLSELLDTYSAARAADFSGIQPAGDGLFSLEQDRSALIADLEQRINAVITDASVTSFVTDLLETKTGYIATVYEWTFFDYDDLSDGEGGSDTAGFGTEHVITFAYNAAGDLELVSDEYTESDVLTGEVPENNVALVDEAEAEGDSLYATTPTFDADFDAVKAALYANTWVTQEDMNGGEDVSFYNPEYRNFASSGGDCANYVSQCLYAGNMDMNTTWYYKSASSFSSAWINCYYQYIHFMNRGTVVKAPTDADVFPGTILYYGSSHVTICVGHNSAGKAVVNGHTADRYRVPWDYSTQTITYVVQLAEYQIENMTFEPDYVLAYEDVSIPVYSFYMDTDPVASLDFRKGNRCDVVTSFTLNGEIWFVYAFNDAIYYGKIAEGIYLGSQVPPLNISAAASVTTNDYLTVTATLPNESISEATLKLTDSSGQTQNVTMTCTDGVASATVDCQDFAAGALTVSVSAVCDIYELVVNSVTVTVSEAATVSGAEGGTITWTLNKTTGALIIYGSGEVTEAGWSRFADKIKTVQTAPDITGLTADQFAAGVLTTIYGQPEYLADVAQELGAEYIAMGHFMDVYPSNWAFAEINEAYEKQLIKGMTDFEFWPNYQMNRGMFVTVLGRIAGVGETEYTDHPFEDVSESAYYAGYVAWAAEKGIVTGKTTTQFAPTEQITREQAIAIIARYLNVYGLELADAEDPADPFTDLDSVSAYAKEHVEAMRLKGIANGRDTGAFCPKDLLSRREATALLLRMYNACQSIASDSSGDSTENGEPAPETTEAPNPSAAAD